MNTISVGTNHFIDETSAFRYYLPYYGGSYRDARFAVETKIREGEIVIGQPQVGVDEILLVNQQEGRYFIEKPL
jgi:hypothetical protein